MSGPITTCMCQMPPAEDEAHSVGLIRRAWRAYWDWRARRVTVMLLSSLDARTLRDIGISPGEVDAWVNSNEGCRRRYDAGWLWRCGGG